MGIANKKYPSASDFMFGIIPTSVEVAVNLYIFYPKPYNYYKALI
jgi:hypothetical protein